MKYSEILQTIVIRDLNKLKSEIDLYKSENSLWKVDNEITNSAGNLCLHLIGNLNTYIGLALGNSGYVRNRELEFSQKNVTKTALISEIDKTILMVTNSFTQITEDSLNLEYPMEVSVGQTTTAYYLTHVLSHLSYHLGQINYHRRFFDLPEEDMPTDILKQIENQFSDNVYTAKNSIHDYYIELKNEYKNHDQIIRAIIYLSNSSLQLLNENISKAKTDWRDVLVMAEYGLDDKKNLVPVRNFNEPFNH